MKIKRLIPLTMLGALVATPVFAMTSESSSDVQFTFQPVLSLSFSESSLSIGDLYPGTFGRSNYIDVVVNTNSISGYTLSAAVGDGTTYLNTNLINNSTATPFTSLAANVAIETIDAGETYSGLPYYGETNWKVLGQTENNDGNKTFQFGIAAKASDSMSSGEYKNVIQFRVIANPIPEEPEPEPGV